MNPAERRSVVLRSREGRGGPRPRGGGDADIHEGAVDDFGDPVVFLLPAGVSDPDGSFSGCTNVSRELAFQLLLAPEDYYVNVHTTLFGAGAARGQLG